MSRDTADRFGLMTLRLAGEPVTPPALSVSGRLLHLARTDSDADDALMQAVERLRARKAKPRATLIRRCAERGCKRLTKATQCELHRRPGERNA